MAMRMVQLKSINVKKMTSKRSHVYSISQSMTQCTTLKVSNGGQECSFFYKHVNSSGGMSKMCYYHRFSCTIIPLIPQLP